MTNRAQQLKFLNGLCVEVFGRSDRGLQRKRNEDQYVIADVRRAVNILSSGFPTGHAHHFESDVRGIVLMVADGVGGSLAGDVASSLAVDAVTEYLTNAIGAFHDFDARRARGDLEEDLLASVRVAHRAVLSDANRDQNHRGMATTLTEAHVMWPRAFVAHIGDSRCYHHRGETLRRVTRDQTVAQELVDVGAMTAEQAERTAWSNVLTGSVGGQETGASPEVSVLDLEVGDSLLLCSDGLTKHVGDDATLAALRRREPADVVVNSLIQAALDDGGTDNVTIALARFLGESDADASL